MPTEEDEITLVVERDNLPALKLWHRRKDSLKQPPDHVAQACREVVEYQLGEMGRRPSMSLSNRPEQKSRIIAHILD